MDDLHEAVAELARSVQSLERRIYALEHSSLVPAPVPGQAAQPAPAASSLQPPAAVHGAGMFSVLGRAMLGIAGAYLLRALAESTPALRTEVVAIAIVYAGLWLVAASRAGAEDWVASITYAGTSVLILVPMLWELTVRFGVLSAGWTAGVLTAYVISASALGWKRRLEAVASMVHACGSIAALALGIAAHDLAPFIAALLIIAAANEVSALLDHPLRARPLVAAAADAAVCALIYIYSSPASAHPDYKAVSAALLPSFGLMLLAIYGASASAQTLLRRRPISFFETGQALTAFLLAAWGVLSFRPAAGAAALGIFCLISSAAGYAAAFAGFDSPPDRRNHYVYASGSGALFLAGCYLSLPGLWLPMGLGAAAVVATILGVRTARLLLAFHGLAGIAAAALSSGLAVYVFRATAGKFPGPPLWIVSGVSLCAVICYGGAVRIRGAQWSYRLLYLLTGALAVSVTAALLTWGLVRLAGAGVAPQAAHLAVVRTVAACAIGLALAYGGSRWRRIEMAWLAYAVLVFVAAKLVFEDLRHGHLAFTAASIFLYAVTLLLVPRLRRLRAGASAAGQVDSKAA